MPEPGQTLKALGGNIDLRVEVDTPFLDEGTFGVYDVSEYDDGSVYGSPDPAWTDITPYVLSAVTRSGKDRWEQRFESGAATFVLDNTDGIWTPDTDQPTPWYLPWRPGRQIRIIAIPDPTSDPSLPSSKVPLWTGEVDSATDGFAQGGYDLTTQVVASDFLARLARINPPALETPTGVQTTSERVHAALDRANWPMDKRDIQAGFHTMQSSHLAQSVLEECQRAAEAEGGAFFISPDGVATFRNRDWLTSEQKEIDYPALVLSKSPLAYWRMSGAGATEDASGNGHDLTWSGSPSTEQEGAWELDEAVSLDGTNDYATVASEDDLEISTNMSIEFWVRVGESQGGGVILSCRGNSPTDPCYEIGIEDVGGIFSSILTFHPGLANNGNNRVLDLGHNYDDGLWHHVVVTIQTNGSNRIITVYRNGIQSTQVQVLGFPEAQTRAVNIGRRATVGTDYFEGDISELAIYDRVLSPKEVHNHYTAGNRSIEIQGYIGFPEDDPEVPEGANTAHILDVKPSWETARIRNDIQLSRVGGTIYQAFDQASIDLYDRRSYRRLDYQNNSQEEIETLADRMLAAWKDNRYRIETVTIGGNEDPDNEDLNRLLWDTRFGDLLSLLIRTRGGQGWSYEVLSTHVMGIEHRISGDDWIVTFMLDDSEAFQDDESESS